MQENIQKKRAGSKTGKEKPISAFWAILIMLAVSWFVYNIGTVLLLYCFPPTPNYIIHTDTLPPASTFSVAISS